MLIRDVMRTKVVTVTSVTRVAEAVRLVQERGIRHLPVVDEERLVGIVSDRDLKRVMHEPHGPIGRVAVAEIMTRAVITVGPVVPVEEAARIMLEEKISALPVVEHGRLVGIVTETDVVELFVRAMGAGEPSSRLDVVLGGAGSALAEMVGAIEGAGVSISSIVTLASPRRMKEAIVRVATINPAAAVRALEAKGFALRDAGRDGLGA